MDPGQEILEVGRERRRVVLEAERGGDSGVQRFYRVRAALLTGGSGFLGKQLAEKLLRSTDIAKLYLLLRPKKGKSIEQRLADMLQEPVFDLVRQQKPGFAARVVAVEGDVARIRLGLSDGCWRALAEEVNVIFHAAATTRFDESLRVATLINVRGTREVLLLARECKNLKSFVHVSTAYSHATAARVGGEVAEQFYESPVPPDTLISLAEKVDNDRLDAITNDLIKGWPNSYTFTKAVGEQLVRAAGALPACVVRPAIVVASYSEPAPGWLDTSAVYGASGIILGIGLGVLHAVYIREDVRLGIIPCDMVTNAVIVAAREAATAQAREHPPRIYTVCSVSRNTFHGGTIGDVFMNEGRRHCVTSKAVSYNWALQTDITPLFMVAFWLMHVAPAYVIDLVCAVTGKERRFVKLTKKMLKMILALSNFTLCDWTFTDKNLEALYNGLSEADKAIYNFDVTCVDWRHYVLIWGIGVRQFLVKDEINDTEYAIRKQFWLKIVLYVWTSFCVYVVWKCLYVLWSLLF